MQRKRLSWPLEASDAARYQGHWVALDNCRYDGGHLPVDGDVVDSDPDLAELCGRLHESNRSKCIVLFCDADMVIDQPLGRE